MYHNNLRKYCKMDYYHGLLILFFFFLCVCVKVSESLVKLYGNVLGHFFNHIWSKEKSTANVYYIDQPCIPSFPIRLVKTESDFIIRSVETGLRKWTLVVAVISVDGYPFVSDLTSLVEDTGIGAFWLHCSAW